MFCYVIINIIISIVNYILGLINFVNFELCVLELSACMHISVWSDATCSVVLKSEVSSLSILLSQALFSTGYGKKWGIIAIVINFLWCSEFAVIIYNANYLESP